MIKNRPTMLMILDGYGIREESHGNAIAAAKKPHLDGLGDVYKRQPWRRAVNSSDFLTGRLAIQRLDTPI